MIPPRKQNFWRSQESFCKVQGRGVSAVPFAEHAKCYLHCGLYLVGQYGTKSLCGENKELWGCFSFCVGSPGEQIMWWANKKDILTWWSSALKAAFPAPSNQTSGTWCIYLKSADWEKPQTMCWMSFMFMYFTFHISAAGEIVFLGPVSSEFLFCFFSFHPPPRPFQLLSLKLFLALSLNPHAQLQGVGFE